MGSWLDAIPNLGVPGVPGVPPQKPTKKSGTPSEVCRVPGVPKERSSASEKSPKTVVEHPEHVEHRAGSKPTSKQEIRTTLNALHRRLSALDPYEVPKAFTLNRWASLVHDCWWLYETHCSRLVREGWSAIDLFGVVPGRAGQGGLANRLYGARNVLFDERGRAFWSRHGVRFSTARQACDALADADLRLVWELER